MSSILSTIGTSGHSVRPQTVGEFIVFQAARKLGDLENAARYVALAGHPRYALLQVYRRLAGLRTTGLGLIQRFEEELPRILQRREDGGL